MRPGVISRAPCHSNCSSGRAAEHQSNTGGPKAKETATGEVKKEADGEFEVADFVLAWLNGRGG